MILKNEVWQKGAIDLRLFKKQLKTAYQTQSRQAIVLPPLPEAWNCTVR